MSMTALLRGVESYVKTRTADVRELHVAVHPDGKPSPKMGTWYVSLFPLGKTAVPSRNAGSRKEEQFRIGATLTCKFNAPRDRQGDVMTLEDVGITDLAERFEDIIHGSNDLLPVANAFLADGGANGPFAEVLLWQSTNYGLRGNEWVYSTMPTGNAPVIFVAEMTFFGAKRARAI